MGNAVSRTTRAKPVKPVEPVTADQVKVTKASSLPPDVQAKIHKRAARLAQLARWREYPEEKPAAKGISIDGLAGFAYKMREEDSL